MSDHTALERRLVCSARRRMAHFVGTRSREQRARDPAVSQQWASHIEGPSMSTALEPLALSPRETAAFLSIIKRSLSRLIWAGKIEARKAGPRTRRCCFAQSLLRVAAEKDRPSADCIRPRAHAVLRPRSQVRH